jgi:hypothetical protein
MLPQGEAKEQLKKLEAPGNREGKKVKPAQKRMEQEYLPGKGTYERAKGICGKRNHYAKTDLDATFMRMKETTWSTIS